MTDKELELFLIEKAESLGLKQAAFDMLNKNLIDEDISLGGFEKHEIKFEFDGYEYRVDRRRAESIIVTCIGFYIECETCGDNLEPIGYFELETNYQGEYLEDWFIIRKEKYLKDISTSSWFQSMNEKLPFEYLSKNHICNDFVSYISMVGTLFESKQFESAGLFIQKAHANLETIDSQNIDQDYLRQVMYYLNKMSIYLKENNLISDTLKNELPIIKIRKVKPAKKR